MIAWIFSFYGGVPFVNNNNLIVSTAWILSRLRIDSGQEKVTSLLDHPAAPSSLSSDANGSEENPNEQCVSPQSTLNILNFVV